MVRTRAAKVERIAESLPPLEVDDPDGLAKVLVLGWGSTYGPIGAGVRRVRKAGYRAAQVHLRHLNPFPRDLGEILARYDKVLIPEMNLGQLALLIRGRYLVDAVGYNQVNGMPLKAADARRGDRQPGRRGRGHRGRPHRPVETLTGDER